MVATMSDADLRVDRGAFFGSIFATLNHLLWGDTLWMSRFDGGDAPLVPARENTALTDSLAAWAAGRKVADLRIQIWANTLSQSDLIGDLTWHSDAMGQEVTKPKALCVTHFFNHQTHHRGQIHAMLTAAGQRPGDTDLFFLSES